MQNLAFILIGLGLLAVIGWALQAFFTDSSIHPLIRIAAGAIGAGTLILIGRALIDRRKQSREDDFTEVDK